MYICTCKYIYEYVCIYTNTCIDTYVYIGTYVQRQVSKIMSLSLCVYACDKAARECQGERLSICIYIYIDIYMYAYIYV